MNTAMNNPTETSKTSTRLGGQSFSPAMRRATLAAAALMLAVLVVFHESAASMVRVWTGSATFGHGFLIPPIVVLLLWRKRNALAATEPRPSALGLVWLGGAAVVWLLGSAGQVELLKHFGLVGMLQGAVLTAMGLAVAKLLVFPLGYMLFMVPFGDFAVAPLQDFTARHTVTLLQLSGIPVLLENWVLTIPGGSFLVAEACAGVRFLIATIALGVLIAGLFFDRWWKRLVFVGLSILVPILANVVRAYGIVVVAHLSDFELAVGVDHLIYGFIFLSFVMAILIGIAVLMRDPESLRAATAAGPAAAPAEAFSGRRLAGPGLGALLLVGLVRGYALYIGLPAETAAADLTPPAAGGGWSLAGPAGPESWHGRYSRADLQRTWLYRGPDGPLSVYVAYYADESEGRELVAYGNLLTPSERVSVVESGRVRNWSGSDLPRPAFEVQQGPSGQRTVWYWYCVDGEVVGDPARAKILALRAKLLRGATPSAVVAVAVPGASAEIETLQDFLRRSELVQAMTSEGLRDLVRSPELEGTQAGAS